MNSLLFDDFKLVFYNTASVFVSGLDFRAVDQSRLIAALLENDVVRFDSRVRNTRGNARRCICSLAEENNDRVAKRGCGNSCILQYPVCDSRACLPIVVTSIIVGARKVCIKQESKTWQCGYEGIVVSTLWITGGEFGLWQKGGCLRNRRALLKGLDLFLSGLLLHEFDSISEGFLLLPESVIQGLPLFIV